MKKENVFVVRYESAVVYINGGFKPHYYTLYFSDGTAITMSFGDINGSIGIGKINEVTGKDYNEFGFIN